MKTVILKGETSSFTIWAENVFPMYQSSIVNFVIDDTKGIATIETMIVEDMEIVNNLKNGFEITIKIAEYGRRDDIRYGTEFIRLSDCEITKKWFNNLTTSGPDNQDVLILSWQVIGNLKINWPKRGA